jgi:hypothetical protein
MARSNARHQALDATMEIAAGNRSGFPAVSKVCFRTDAAMVKLEMTSSR